LVVCRKKLLINNQKRNKMKRNIFIIRKVLVGLMLATVMFAAPASAKPSKKAATPVVKIEPTVEFISGDENSTLLHVSFNSDSAVKIELTVSDANGTTVYSQTYEAAKFSKYIKWLQDGENSDKMTVTVRTLPNGQKHTFNIVNEDKTINEISVVKL
jgi:hypothetical protein